MTFTYDGPSASDKDVVRFLLQDTNQTTAHFSDEEITYTITKWKDLHGSLEFVASTLADTAAAKYAREASFSADGVSVTLGGVAQQFRDLAAALRAQHKNLLVGGTPDVGGISPDEQPDPTIAPFSFGTGMHDDLEAGPQDFGSRYPRYYNAEYNPGV